MFPLAWALVCLYSGLYLPWQPPPAPAAPSRLKNLKLWEGEPNSFPCVWVTTRSGYVWHAWPVGRPPDDRWAAAQQCQASYSSSPLFFHPSSCFIFSCIPSLPPSVAPSIPRSLRFASLPSPPSLLTWLYLALATAAAAAAAAAAACHFCCHFCNYYCDCSCNRYCDRHLCNASLLKTQLSVSNLLPCTEERSARKNVRTQKQCCNGMVGLGSLGGGSAPVVSCMYFCFFVADWAPNQMGCPGTKVGHRHGFRSRRAGQIGR